jgi:hypothetical protein
MMDENVRTTLTGEETEALGLVEPLDSTFDHLRAGLLGLCLVPRHLRANEKKAATMAALIRYARQRQLLRHVDYYGAAAFATRP